MRAPTPSASFLARKVIILFEDLIREMKHNTEESSLCEKKKVNEI